MRLGLAYRYARISAICLHSNESIPSMSRTQDPLYKELGLADAAIGAVAKTCGCAVLTDDLDLYLRLSRDGVEALNFAHLQAANWGWRVVAAALIQPLDPRADRHPAQLRSMRELDTVTAAIGEIC